MTDPTTTSATRHDGRTLDQTREVRITRNWLDHAEGSVLVEFGRTRVLCAASFTEGVPRWLKGRGTRDESAADPAPGMFRHPPALADARSSLVPRPSPLIPVFNKFLFS